MISPPLPFGGGSGAEVIITFGVTFLAGYLFSNELVYVLFNLKKGVCLFCMYYF